MARAAVVALMIVATSVLMALADVNLYWAEFALAMAAVVGLATLVAVASVPRPFVKAAILSFSAIACLQCVSYLKMAVGPTYLQPTVLPAAGITILSMTASSAMLSGIAGVVAIAIRSVRVKRARPPEQGLIRTAATLDRGSSTRSQ